MSDRPTRRYPMFPDLTAIPHSGLCDAGRLVTIDGRTIQPLCTCGAGLLRLLAGGR